LALATLNVMAFAVALTGGIAWAFDFSSVDDVKARARMGLARRTRGVGGEGEKGEMDREVEEWVAGWLEKVGVDVEKGGGKGKEGETGDS